jgi:hypothetical protein
MHLTSQPPVDFYHAALSLLLRPLRLRSPDQPQAVHLFQPRPGRTSTIGLHRAVERAWASMTTISPAWPVRRDAEDDLTAVLPLLDASGAYASPRALLSRSTLLLRSRTSTWPMREIPQPSKTQAARFLHPRLWRLVGRD